MVHRSSEAPSQTTELSGGRENIYSSPPLGPVGLSFFNQPQHFKRKRVIYAAK